MRRVSAAVAAVALVGMLSGATPAGAYPNPRQAYGDAGVHDPALLIRNVTPRYVLFSTHTQSRISTDRTVFVSTPKQFDPPEWSRDYGSGNTWAPHVSYHDGLYWLYYAASQVGSQHSAIGLVTSVTAEPRSWVDRGLVIASEPGMDYNAIDPHLLVDPGGRWWLTFGSGWRGIYVVELDPASGKVKAGASPVHVAEPSAGTPVTAPSMYRHGGYYYLFAGYGSCCPPVGGNVDPTSSIRVGRATAPTGPFADRNGVAMLSGGGTRILESHGDYRGPGGPLVVHDPREDTDLLVYHWYDRRLGYLSFLGINFLAWDAAGWPYPAL